ncbi:nucleoside triphosphate pyrophosphohydrolase [Thermoflavimicrobium dichotomicum]|uniref:Tetrapyrrole methylase family protein / MazG family protein n=1 Tax=Thermoflavimicrobium dichotomicum TaxID=46223 RepID=A0A1I3QQ62_9BACL|nr:nucleoside triphosphate pyrophosphohydrolase [Thermoflavimicrobium dichotomicum]SFJ35669.1 tetrapyrrole methylase family protein / MazG family protein [Thermoflavimicrobium dichotomicum]
MKKKIVVVGLGFGDETALPIGTVALFSRSEMIWLRTEKHPAVHWIREKGIPFQTFDEVYEMFSDFESVYQEIAQRLLQLTEMQEIVVYAVPGHPMVAERTVQLLRQLGPQYGVEIDIRGGGSFLDIAFARLGIDPIEGFMMVDGNSLRPEEINPRLHILIGQVYDRIVASDIKLTLMEVYPDDYEIHVVTALGIEGMETVHRLPLYELDRIDAFTDLTSIYIPPVSDEQILYRRFDYLTQIIAHLRSPEGCPWDRKQTHQSLLPYLIEEAYEFIEAVHNEDVDAMMDELGDVLLQVMLHAQIAKEEGVFDIHEVIQGLNAKMIRRHPHVFGEEHAETAEEVKQNWEEIKRKERQGEETSSILDEISKGLPVLLQAFEQHKKAAKVGFDWDKKEDVLLKVEEELAELRKAETKEEQEEEIGDLLFILTSVARMYEVHPEIALWKATQKFARRFRYLEDQARKTGRKLQEIPMEQLDEWWEESKQQEKGE